MSFDAVLHCAVFFKNRNVERTRILMSCNSNTYACIIFNYKSHVSNSVIMYT